MSAMAVLGLAASDGNKVSLDRDIVWRSRKETQLQGTHIGRGLWGHAVVREGGEETSLQKGATIFTKRDL